MHDREMERWYQFGNWAGQLGGGRAINLGEIINRRLERWALQLKGAGPTPYARTADGLAVLRSSVREFLCSEAMFHLEVPTTRALSLIAPGEPVERDMFYNGHLKEEPGAVVCRFAPSFAIYPLIEEARPLQQAVDLYAECYLQGWKTMMALKLGLSAFDPYSDEALISELLSILPAIETDMKIFFHRLSDLDISVEPLADISRGFFPDQRIARSAP